MPRTIMAPVMDAERGTINRIRAIAREKGFSAGAVRPFSLRMYAALTATKGNLTFQPNIGVSVNHAMEILLEKTDIFFCNKMGLGIHKVLISGTAEIPANTPIIHYPDRNWFTVANEARDLEILYNGLLELKTDTDVRLEVFDTKRLRHVPQTQYNATAGTGTMWQVEGNEMKELPMNFALWGNKRNKFVFEAKAGSYANWFGAAGTSQNYAVLFLDGYLIVNGAESVTVSDLSKVLV